MKLKLCAVIRFVILFLHIDSFTTQILHNCKLMVASDMPGLFENVNTICPRVQAESNAGHRHHAIKYTYRRIGQIKATSILPTTLLFSNSSSNLLRDLKLINHNRTRSGILVFLFTAVLVLYSRPPLLPQKKNEKRKN